MPLSALKHRCLEFCKERSLLIECFEQASFLHALNNAHVYDVLRLQLPAPLAKHLPFIAHDELNIALASLRMHHLPLVVKIEVLSLIAHERLSFLRAALLQSRGKEREWISTAYDSIFAFCEYIFEHAQDEQIGLFFNDFRTAAPYFERSRIINLVPFSQLFDWPATPKSAHRAAARAFFHLLHARNRRAKFLAVCKSGEFAELGNFFAEQERVFLALDKETAK